MHVAPGAGGAAVACALAVELWIGETLAARPYASLALSGGKTPARMLAALRERPIRWEGVHIFQVDERGVPPDHPDSNYKMIEECLIRPARIPPANVHRMRGEMAAVEAAGLYAAEIREVLGGAPLDIVQCGIGVDAHTASLFPGEALVLDREGMVAGLWVEEKRQWRITLLGRAILGARHLCVLATGAEKAVAVRRALEGDAAPLETPAQMLRAAEWFLDGPAAALVAAPGGAPGY